jgi:hypothetical protein
MNQSDKVEGQDYNDVLRSILWGKDQGEMIQEMESYGTPRAQAERLVALATAERIALIRASAIRKVMGGGIILAVSVGLYLLFWRGLGAITYRLGWLSIAAGSFGAWQLLAGSTSFIFAALRKGPIDAE